MKIFNTLKGLIYLSALALFVSSSVAQAQVFETAYGRKANVAILRKVLMLTDLKQVTAEMEKFQVKIYKVVDPNLKGKSKHFSFLPEVPKHLRESLSSQMAEVSDESAIFVSWNDICCNSNNVLLVSEAAQPATLFHEFTHHLFEMQNRNDTVLISDEQKEVGEFLTIYNRRISAALLDENSFEMRHWRENFDSYVDDYSRTFDTAQGQLKAEEVAIETGLAKLMIEIHSPWFSQSRAREGVLIYGQKIIINGTLSLLEATKAFMSKLRRTPKEIGSADWTPEEDERRARLQATILQRLENYRRGPLSRMQQQVNEAKDALDKLK
ncbi:MAG TPA: hypothetical protein VGE46_07970 [Bdellovibrio sp.]